LIFLIAWLLVLFGNKALDLEGVVGHTLISW
jgi:hypothetical protein